MPRTALASPSAPEPAPELTPALTRLAGVVLIGALIVQLDVTMTNIAFNSLLTEFDASLATMQWVGTGYLLAMTTMIPLTGWAVERFGTKAMWLFSIATFMAGSLLSGLAWSAGSLIAFRVVQGVGGGMILPLAQMILALAAGPQRMGRLMAAIGVPAMLGPVLGPVLGGLIVSELSWRWIFFANLPICIAALVLAWRVMANVKRDAGVRLDLLGLALLSPATALIVYGLAAAGNLGRFSAREVIVPMTLGIGLLVAFGIHALRTRIPPLIDLCLFRVRKFAASSAVVFLSSVALFGAMILLPVYYQQARGESALHAGLLLVPQGIGMGLALIISGRLTDRMAPRPIVLTGLALSAAGTLVFTQIGPYTSELLLGAAVAISGVGMGAAIVPVLAVPYRGLPTDAIPRATSAIRILQQLGGALGGAVLVVVLQQQIRGMAGASIAKVDPAGLADAFGFTFWWVLAFTGVAFLAALALPGVRSRTRS